MVDALKPTTASSGINISHGTFHVEANSRWALGLVAGCPMFLVSLKLTKHMREVQCLKLTIPPPPNPLLLFPVAFLFVCSIHNKPVSKLWEFTAVDSVPVTAKAMLPSSSAITIQLGAGVRMITFVNTVPINENKCVNRCVRGVGSRWGLGGGQQGVW
jgi:hypothetical protein